jgi:hypothetical protein
VLKENGNRWDYDQLMLEHVERYDNSVMLYKRVCTSGILVMSKFGCRSCNDAADGEEPQECCDGDGGGCQDGRCKSAPDLLQTTPLQPLELHSHHQCNAATTGGILPSPPAQHSHW